MSRGIKEKFEIEQISKIGGGARGFESASAYSTSSIDWQQFHNFLLQRMNEKTAEDRLMYAKRCASILVDGSKAQSLLQLKPDKRIHCMKAISCLARYTGQYDRWHQLRQSYNLTWSTGTEKIDAFTRFLDSSKTLETMIEWLRQAMRALPKTYSDFFLFCTLTGLRCSEALASVKLIKNPETFKIYYSADQQMLQHFAFPDIFIRRTKAAYISLVNKEILGIVQNLPQQTPTYNGLKLICRRRSLSMRIKYCRKIYSSWLRQSGGIESEIIDMLSGRVGKNIFLRHYYTPSLNYRAKVLDSIQELHKALDV